MAFFDSLHIRSEPLALRLSPARAARRIWWRYAAGLALFVSLAAVGIVMIMPRLETLRALDGEINRSGLQRMLSQRIALLSLELRISADADRAPLRISLKKAIDRFEASNNGLSSLDPQRAAPLSPTLRNIYYGPKVDLARRSRRFVLLGRAALASNGEAESTHDLRHEAEDLLLPSLIDATAAWEAEANAVGRQIEVLEEIWAVAGVALILFELLMIFRPAQSIMRRTFDQLETQLSEAIAREAALSELQRLSTMAEAVSGLGYWRVDALTHKSFWSKQVYVLHGLDPDGQPPDMDQSIATYHPEDQATVAEMVRAALTVGQPFDFCLRLLRRDGEERQVMAKGVAERDADGAITTIFGVILDVTESKRIELQLRAAQAKAEQAANVKAEFLANMSHELRTPLTSIIGFTGLAVEQTDPASTIRNYLERVRGASNALLCTVNDILDFSKLEAGQVAIHPRPVAVADFCRGALEQFTPQAAAKPLDLTLDAPDGDLTLLIDPDRIRQILLNLVGNAVKFTASGGVTLRARYSGETLSIEVIDTGPGIADDKQDGLFKRFSQIDGSLTRAYGGTGLGLAICKGLVEAMGGRIGLDSRIGDGSRFWISLPAAAIDFAQIAEDGGALELDGVRVLVLDDHAADRDLARLLLMGAGALVSEAADGVEAVEIASQWPFDAIVMNGQVAGLGGAQVLRAIRGRAGPNDSIPVIVYGEGIDAEARDRLTAQGFDAVLGKPVQRLALFDAIVSALALPAAATQETQHNVG